MARRSDHPWARSFRLYLLLGLMIVDHPRRLPDRLRRRGLRQRAGRPARRSRCPTGSRGAAARADHAGGAAGRALRRAAARRDRDLHRRRQLARQPEAAAQVGAAGALRDRHRARRRGHRLPAAGRQRPPGARGPGAARRTRAAGSGGCAGSSCRCSRTRSSARWRWRRAWTRAATAAPVRRRAASDGRPASCCWARCAACASAPTRCSTTRRRAGWPCRCWSLGAVRRGRRAASAPAAGSSARATAPTAGAPPSSWWPASGLAVGVAIWRLGRTEPLVIYPSAAAMPYLSVLALGGALLGLVPAVAAPPPRAAHLDPAGGGRVIELRNIHFAYEATRRSCTASTSPSRRASWCWSPAAPASASRRCSAC